VDWVEEEISEGDKKVSVQCMDRATVEDKIMNNEKRWITETSPSMMEPLRGELGFLADTEAWCRILNSTYISPWEWTEILWNFFNCYESQNQ